MNTKKIAIVTGGNRGLGYEICRQLAKKGFKVILTARDSGKGQIACEQLRIQNLDVDFQELDVSSTSSIDNFIKALKRDYNSVEVLVNNAGVMNDRDKGIESIPIDLVKHTFETNVLGPLYLIQSILPLMRKNNYGRIVNISSELGSLNQMGGGYPAYRMSKTGINVLTRIFASELSGSNILINSMSPGWVKTDMGGSAAPRTVEEGADTVIWLATLPDLGPSGGFYKDRKMFEW